MTTSPHVRPERIAAATRALGGELSDRVRIYADALADALARELHLVAWDREQTIGQLQSRLERLRSVRVTTRGGAVRVLERGDLPLESVDRVWEELRAGRRVRLEHAVGACSAATELMRGMARVLEMSVGAPVLEVASAPYAGTLPLVHTPTEAEDWAWAGVFAPKSRVAWIEASADRELAAYVLARTSLRRAGTDPRAIKRAYVVQPDERLYRHLTRLWVGVEMGPPESSSSFAGPVSEEVVAQFEAAHAAWSKFPDVQVLCPGGVVERSGDRRHYLAPALFSVPWPGPDLPMPGPILALVRASTQEARASAEAVLREGGHVVTLGVRQHVLTGNVRAIQGALLTERLPPGLPEPRPV